MFIIIEVRFGCLDWCLVPLHTVLTTVLDVRKLV